MILPPNNLMVEIGLTDLPQSVVLGMAPPAPQMLTALTDSTLPHHHLHACPKNFQHVRRSFSTSHPSDNKGLFWLSDFLSVWSFPVNQRLLSRPLQLPICLAFDCLWPTRRRCFRCAARRRRRYRLPWACCCSTLADSALTRSAINSRANPRCTHGF